MGIFNKLKGPVFLKESNNAKEELNKLKELYNEVDDSVKKQLERDIKILSYGIIGEEKIAFELKNSHIPMYILHDLYFELDGLTAQIDYLIITRKCNFVIECKNLFGNVEINNSGDFIRSINLHGRFEKEGIYSPITQNKRHLELIKELRGRMKGNILTRTLFNKNFYNTYRSVVVLANPKTILNSKYAKKEVKDKVIKVDQLIDYINKVNFSSKIENSSDKQMEHLGQVFLDLHVNKKIDYHERYKEFVVSDKEDDVIDKAIDTCELFNELKEYRLLKSREENVKPYFIFTNRHMENLIEKMPQTINDLIKVEGFGKVKCERYGDEILKILEK